MGWAMAAETELRGQEVMERMAEPTMTWLGNLFIVMHGRVSCCISFGVTIRQTLYGMHLRLSEALMKNHQHAWHGMADPPSWACNLGTGRCKSLAG